MAFRADGITAADPAAAPRRPNRPGNRGLARQATAAALARLPGQRPIIFRRSESRSPCPIPQTVRTTTLIKQTMTGSAELIWAGVKATGQLLWWAILFPALSIPRRRGDLGRCRPRRPRRVRDCFAAVAAYIGWAVLEPASFTRWVSAPLRHRWLAWWRYHRTWESVCALHGLTAKHGERTLVPAVISARIGHHADTPDREGRDRPMPHRLAETRSGVGGGVAGRAVDNPGHHAGQVRIIIGRGDVLGQPIALPIPRPATPVDLGAVRVGITEARTCGGCLCLGSTCWSPAPLARARVRCCGKRSPD